MKKLSYILLLWVISFPAMAQDYFNLGIAIDNKTDIRYCGAVERYSDGSIKRSQAVLTAFQKIHPCPSTGLTTGACPGWALDHVVPLACGGCDAVFNLQWLPDAGKSCGEPYCKDRYERKIYSAPFMLPGQNNNCSMELPIK